MRRRSTNSPEQPSGRSGENQNEEADSGIGNGERNPKKGGAYLQQKRVARYEFIAGEKEHYPITLLCRVLAVTRSACYAYRAGKQAEARAEEQQRAPQVKQVFYENRRRYGTRRTSQALKRRGNRTLAGAMKWSRKSGIKSCPSPSFDVDITPARIREAFNNLSSNVSGRG